MYISEAAHRAHVTMRASSPKEDERDSESAYIEVVSILCAVGQCFGFIHHRLGGSFQTSVADPKIVGVREFVWCD
jgi:hypothetical protein